MDLRYGIAGALVIGLALGGAIPFVSAEITQHPEPEPERGAWRDTDRADCQVWNPEQQPREALQWDGACVDGKVHGEGVLTWTVMPPAIGAVLAKETFFGHFEEGRRKGWGSYKDYLGNLYEGEWRGSTLNGPGQAWGVAGWQYEGNWRDSLFDGYGVLHMVDESTYRGEWRLGMMHGQGMWSTGDRRMYEGEWRDGRPHGEGMLMDRAVKLHGEWQNGCLDAGEIIGFVGKSAEECGS